MPVTTLQPVRIAMTPQDWERHPATRTGLLSQDEQRHSGVGSSTAITADNLSRFPQAGQVTSLDAPSGKNRPIDAQAQHQQLTDTSEKWVAQTFFGTMLKQMRNSPFKSELFSGGRGGEAFSEMYDQHLAERMAHSSGRQLAASVVKHIERQRARMAGAAGNPVGKTGNTSSTRITPVTATDVRTNATPLR